MKTNPAKLPALTSALLIFSILACQTATAVPTPREDIFPTETAIPLPAEPSATAPGTTAPTLVTADTAVPTADTVVPLGERSLADRPDDQPSLYQVHVLYVLPAGSTD